MTIHLEPLTRDSLQMHLPAALEIEQASGLPILWNAENFSYELPEKWNLSRWVMHSEHPDRPMGYAILSRKTPHSIHLHRLVIAPNNRGYGTQTMHQLIAEMRQHAPMMTVKTVPGADRVQQFYERLGFLLIFPSQDGPLLLKILSPDKASMRLEP